jgi:thioredoxin-dependent peroxiredoxin
MLENSTKAPGFSLPDHGGQAHNLADLKGKWVVLYFYPKDNTPGCTNEAIDFTEAVDEFTSMGAVILGVSPDSSKSHVNFINKHNLKITLLSDPEHVMMVDYHAWGMKKNYGKEYEGVIRSTYLIDPEGTIAHSWNNVKVRVKRKAGEVKHVAIVQDRLAQLQAED